MYIATLNNKKINFWIDRDKQTFNVDNKTLKIKVVDDYNLIFKLLKTTIKTESISTFENFIEKAIKHVFPSDRYLQIFLARILDCKSYQIDF